MHCDKSSGACSEVSAFVEEARCRFPVEGKPLLERRNGDLSRRPGRRSVSLSSGTLLQIFNALIAKEWAQERTCHRISAILGEAQYLSARGSTVKRSNDKN